MKPIVLCGVVGGVVALAVIIAVIALLIDASHTVAIQEVGLDYNKYTGVVKFDKVYTRGRYWTGPGHTFIKFPTVNKNVDFQAVKMRSSDGVEVTADLSFQYSVLPEAVPEFFQRYGTDYQDNVLLIVLNSVRYSASFFNVTDFFERRTVVTSFMSNHTSTQLEEVGVLMGSLQFNSPGLPSAYQLFINIKTATAQAVAAAQNQRDVAKTQANTRLAEERNAAQARVVRVRGRISGTLSGQKQAVDGEYVKLMAQAEAYSAFKVALNFTATEFMNYMWTDTLGKNVGSKLVVLDRPTAISIDE